MNTFGCPPVLLIVFNRPDLARRVIAAIRSGAPRRLYIAADGPRSSETHPEDARCCEETRRVLGEIDWPCEVRTLFQPVNPGCGRAVSTAISWFFDNEPEGVVLEDDCLPHPDFFNWSGQMLDRYRNEARVLHVNGTNFGAPARMFGDREYLHASFPLVWGWASWARAWKHYRFRPDADPAFVPPGPLFKAAGVSSWQAEQYRVDILKALGGVINTWDYQWGLANFKHGGQCPTPRINLIANIGFTSQATHGATSPQSSLANLPTDGLRFSTLEKATDLAPSGELNSYIARLSLGSSWKLAQKACKRQVRQLLGIKREKDAVYAR